MTNDINHIAAQELICTMVLPELADALAVACEALQADCDMTADDATLLIYGYFQRFISMYPQHAHRPDYGALYWQLDTVADDVNYTVDDDNEDDEPPLYGDLPAVA